MDTGLLNFALTSSMRCILVCSCSVPLSANILLHIVQLNVTAVGLAGTGVIVVVADEGPEGGGANSSELLIVVVPGAVACGGGGVTLDPSRK